MKAALAVPVVGWRPPPPVFGNIDPGKMHAGFTIFRNSKVVAAKLLKTERWPGGVLELAQQATALCIQASAFPLPLLCFEFPEVRHAAGEHELHVIKQQFPLAFLCGVMVMATGAQELQEVNPSTWKGGVDPDGLTNRIYYGDPSFGLKPKLLPEEIAVIGKCEHNVVDSAGLGLWRLGRLHPGRR